jgi:hypothetical protein
MAEITRSTLKAGRWTYTAEELDRMCAEAAQRGDDELRCKPQARSVRYEQETGQVWIELNNGCTLVVPTRLLQTKTTVPGTFFGLEPFSDPRCADAHPSTDA